MKKLRFPALPHKRESIKNVNELFDEQATQGQHAADRLAAVVGSWKFIIGQSIILVIWMVLNITAWFGRWDPYPFILMNLFLSMQAAFTAPIIMMSQNRQAAKDRLESHHDYLVNLKAEGEVRVILEHLAAQNEALIQIHQLLDENYGAEADTREEA